MTAAHQSSDTPYWKQLTNVISGLIGFAGLCVTLSPIFSPSARSWYGAHGVAGWTLAALAILAGAIILTVTRARYLRNTNNIIAKGAEDLKKASAKHKEDLEAAAVSAESIRLKAREDALNGVHRRALECQKDIETTQNLWGAFFTGAPMRDELDYLPSDKYFTTALSQEFYALQERLEKGNWRILDAALKSKLESLSAAMHLYWDPVRNLLDSSDHPHWNLKIMTPPGGGWNLGKGDSTEENPYGTRAQWDEYNDFVRSLVKKKWNFFEALDSVEQTLGDLKVDAALSPRNPGSTEERLDVV